VSSFPNGSDFSLSISSPNPFTIADRPDPDQAT
jgi:hypothetical protein